MVSVLVCAPLAALAGGMGDLEDTRRFVREMASRHGFHAGDLSRLFSKTEPDAKVLNLISRPAEKKEWAEYRPIFVTRKRAAGGQLFMRRHAEVLERAEKVYGVPASIITAIIGVETRYGANTGSHKVFRSLATIAFYYPRRADFFRRELEQFLLLTRDLRLPPDDLRGSYAGAMGIPQFLSSSYRHYAVDFDGDGDIDIWNDETDAIGSVANYLSDHGWSRESAVAERVTMDEAGWRRLTADGPRLTVERLRAEGVIGGDNPGAVGEERRLIRLLGDEGPEYWAADVNFDVITKYNHSDLYAMAVFQLAELISPSAEREESR